MNERIRELIRKTSFIDTELLTEPQTVMLEKFAELIVKECASINYNSPFHDGEFHAREILEHFGVEE